MIRIAAAVVSLFLLASCASGPQINPGVRSEFSPTGKMRVGLNYGNPLFAVRDARTGEGSGIAVDLAHELGRRLGLPVQLVGYNSGGQLTAGLKAGEWDVAFLAFEQSRANEIGFSTPYAEIDSTYLVHAGSSLRTAADLDRKGVRIGASAGGGNELFLSRHLKNATLIRLPNSEAALKAFVAKEVDGIAGLKPTLLAHAEKIPGSRVVDGRYTVIGYSAGVPKGREAAARYLTDFVEYAKSSGLVAESIARHNVRGVTVAPAGAQRIEIRPLM